MMTMMMMMMMMMMMVVVVVTTKTEKVRILERSGRGLTENAISSLSWGTEVLSRNSG
jgi:hypothetical protein